MPTSTSEQIDLVRRLLPSTLTDADIALAAGLTRRTVNRWKNHGFPTHRSTEPVSVWHPSDPTTYAYLLGLYLGDGHISHHGGNCFGLSISLDDNWPQIIEECRAAMAAISTGSIHEYRRPGSNGVRIYSYSKIWPAALPQHGPGKKHSRNIELAPWQAEILDHDPRPFLRGLIHSDGSRCANRFKVKLKSGVRAYSYPRYFFSNFSADIRGLFCRYCDRLGIRWTQSNLRNISVSHRDSVAILDSFIGPKS